MFDETLPDTSSLTVKDSQREFKAIQKALDRVSSVDIKSAEGLQDYEKAIQKVPEDLGATIQTAREGALAAVERERAERAGGIRKIRSDFIESLRRDGISFRETEGWRIGRLELFFDLERATLSVQYNREKLLSDAAVMERGDVDRHLAAAEKLLDASLLPLDILTDAMSDAFEYIAAQTGSSTERVKLKEAHAELRVAALRIALGTRPSRKVAPREMPVWAYLHNLDQYLALGSKIPSAKRLHVQTGSQRDTARFGMTLGGLSPDQPYRSYCYLERAG